MDQIDVDQQAEHGVGLPRQRWMQFHINPLGRVQSVSVPSSPLNYSTNLCVCVRLRTQTLNLEQSSVQRFHCMHNAILSWISADL